MSNACEICYSTGSDDEGEPQMLCNSCQNSIAETAGNDAAKQVAVWLLGQSVLDCGHYLPERARRELAEAVRTGVWRVVR